MAPRLKTVNDRSPEISGAMDATFWACFLEEPLGRQISMRIGEETQTDRRAINDSWTVDVTRGESFPSPTLGGKVTGGRYLMRDRRVGGRIIGALNYTLLSKASGKAQAVVSNLVVDPCFRRQGVGTRLLQAFVSDFPAARVDTAMTLDGAAFFGYSPAAKETAPTPGRRSGARP